MPDKPIYIYSEYCPGPFYWGWWLYYIPVVDDLPRYERDAWLKYDWQLDAVMRALGLPELHDYRGFNHGRYVTSFHEKYPVGVLAHTDDRERNFVVDPDQSRAWKFFVYVRVQREMSWRDVRDERHGGSKKKRRGKAEATHA